MSQIEKEFAALKSKLNGLRSRVAATNDENFIDENSEFFQVFVKFTFQPDMEMGGGEDPNF